MSERVRIQLGDTESYVVERYEISRRFFTKPGAFAVRVGHGGITKDLLAKYPPGTSFTLWLDVDGRSIPMMTGRIDEPTPEGSGGATMLNLRGRDWLMPLVKGMPRVERTWSSATFKKLVEDVIVAAGVKGYALAFSRAADAAAIQGTPKFDTKRVKQTFSATSVGEEYPPELRLVGMHPDVGPVFQVQTPRTGTTVVSTDVFRDVTVEVGRDVPNPLKAKIGQTWLHFLEAELNRAGLFIFASVEERNYIITQPSTTQPPKFRIARTRGDSRGVISARHRNSTSNRHSHYTVYGRGGGGKDPRTQVVGEYIDQEMIAWGLESQWSKSDDLAKTSKQAEYLAKRHAAEARRQGWELVYTLKGHTWPLVGGNGAHGVLDIDTMVDVADDEYGIYGPHWIEGIAMRGAATGAEGTTTEVTLMRPADLVFGDVVLDPKAAKKKGWQKKS